MTYPSRGIKTPIARRRNGAAQWKTLCGVLLMFVLAGCAAPQRQSIPPLKRPPDQAPVKLEARSPIMRVAIALRRSDVKIRFPREYTVTGLPVENGTPDASDGVREVRVTADRIRGDSARLTPLKSHDEVWVDGKPYHGALEVRVDRQSTITVVNEVPLEEYLLGVLSGEVPKDWPLEALKAQAVAARTFAVRKRDEARAAGLAWDLENTNLYQVYEGSGKIGGGIQRAVKETNGIILTHGSRPIQAMFHSNCGGRTSRASDVWSSDQPYLRSVACGYCAKGAHYHWRAELLIPDLVRKLRTSGMDLSDVAGLKVEEWDASGRVRRLVILDADGKRIAVRGSQFRMAVGPDLVKSARFEAEILSDRVVFRGRGWGHGVGLCQEGAEGMARAGFNAFEILRKYYPGVIKERLK